MTSRAAQRSWSTAWQTAPPSACSTLINNAGVVNWGSTCVFPENGQIINPVNTACLPWAASSSTGAFFSPVTACPTSWSAVATQTSGSNMVDGETAILCCPAGFEANGNNCRPRSAGTFPVVECGEADAEENEHETYSGAAWPARATVSIAALQIRYQASDIRSVSATGSSTSTSSTPTSAPASIASVSNGGGLSTAAKIAIGVAVPVFFLICAISAFLFWRRRKQKKTALLASTRLADEKKDRLSGSGAVAPIGTIAAAANHNPRTHNGFRDTPEWNHELESTDVERQGQVVGSSGVGTHTSTSRPYIAYTPVPSEMAVNEPVRPAKSPLYTAYTPAPSEMDASEVTAPAELSGMGRATRKPVAPVEIDGQPLRAELGDGK